MSRQRFPKQNRGTTLVEILVAVFLLTIIFLFITADLIGSSQAENVSATRSATMNAANYMLGVMRTDPKFWNGDWTSGPLGGSTDPCGNSWAPYTDSITSPVWHPAPACTPNGSNPGLFPEYAGLPSDTSGLPMFSYMWNAQLQGGDPNLAQLTVWVRIDEGGRTNIYEEDSTRGQIVIASTNTPVLPTPATIAPSPPCSGCASSPPASKPPASPTPKPSPTAKPSPTPTPSRTPTPTPVPSGTFE